MPPKKRQKTTSPEHEADQREMDRLETEIATLKQTNKNLHAIAESYEEERDLWKDYAHGLEARIKLYSKAEAKKSRDNLAPMMLGVLGGVAGNILADLGRKAMTKP